MRPTTARRARLGLVALALPLLAVGCQDDGQGSGSDTSLADLPGVSDTFVGDIEVEDGVTQRVVVVDADPDATAEQVTDVLEAMGKADPEDSRLYLGAGTTDWALPTGDPTSRVAGGADPEEDADRTAGLLLAGAGLAGATAEVDADTGGVELSLFGGDATAVTVAARSVVDDPALSVVPVSVSAYDVGTGSSVPVATLGSEGTLTAALVDAWDELVVSATGLASPTLSYPALVSAADGATQLSVGLQFAEDVMPDDVTTETYGDVLWPVVRPLLDRLRDSPTGSRLQLVRASRDQSVYDVFLDVSVGPDGELVAAPDPEGRTWGAEALAQ